MNTILTLERLGMALVLTLALSGAIRAQIHVDSLKDVGIGTDVPGGVKLKVKTTDENKAVHIIQNADIGGQNYGIYIEVEEAGSGGKTGIFNRLNQDPDVAKVARGIHNIVNAGYSSSYGIFNTLSCTGGIDKFGFFNTTTSGNSEKGYGIFNSLDPTDTDYACGFKNIVESVGIGKKYGIDNSVTQGSGSSEETRGIYNYTKGAGSGLTYGIYNLCDSSINLTGAQKGINNLLYEKTPTHPMICPQKYGIDNRVYPDANTCSGFYGIYNFIDSEGDVVKYGVISRVEQVDDATAPVYGMHSTATASGGEEPVYGLYGTVVVEDTVPGYAVYGTVDGAYADSCYAGYFDGRVVMTQGWSMSDARVKKNVENFSMDATDLLKSLRPVAYEFDREVMNSAPGGRQYGFIAQEVESIVPEIVTNVRVPGKTLYETVTEEIEVDSATTRQSTKVVPIGEEPSVNRKAINYEAFIPILVKAIQEQEEERGNMHDEVVALKSESESQKRMIADQQAQIDIQKNLIADLIGRIETLEKR